MHMRPRTLIALALVLPSALAAQAPATAAPRDPVMFAFENFADIFGSRLKTAFDSIPESRYDYRPTPVQQSSACRSESENALSPRSFLSEMLAGFSTSAVRRASTSGVK